jgi:O-antigen/teichoic acid export membrane protein
MKQTNPAVKYGMMGAIILVVLGIGMQLMLLSSLRKGAENPAGFSFLKLAGVQIISFLLIAGVFIFCIVRSMKDYRKLNSDYTYNSLVKQGLLATLIITVVSSLFSYLYGYVIAPESREEITDLMKRIFEGAPSMTDAQREKALSQLENQNPVRQMITGFAITLVLGLVTSLISASVLKKKYDINNPNHIR